MNIPCRTSIAYSCANHSRSGSLDSNAPGMGPGWKHLLQVTILLLRRFWYKQDSRIWKVCSMNALAWTWPAPSQCRSHRDRNGQLVSSNAWRPPGKTVQESETSAVEKKYECDFVRTFCQNAPSGQQCWMGAQVVGHAELRPTNSGCVNPANLGVLMGSDRPHLADPERFSRLL